MNEAREKLAHSVAKVVRELPDPNLDQLVKRLEESDAKLESAVSGVVTNPQMVDLLSKLVKRTHKAELTGAPQCLAQMIRACRETRRDEKQAHVELVWTGPNPPASVLYRTEQTLLELIKESKKSLLIVTFAAYKVEAIRKALKAAADRGVLVDLVVESDGAKVSQDPLYALLSGETKGLRVYIWPVEKRLHAGDKYGTLHAKCAAADDEVLLVSSANMTSHALELNMELGVLVRGGGAAKRVRKHFEDLVKRGILEGWV